MANPEHLAILKQGVEKWNNWREKHPEVLPDLNEADLSGLDVVEEVSVADDARTIIFRKNLAGADFSRAGVSRTDLTWANLSEANLRKADLEGANLRWATLGGANLSQANLSEANL